MLKIFSKKIMKLNKIKIQMEFVLHPPRPKKMIHKRIFYLVHRKFEQPIIVNKDNILIDGYTTYLLAKRYGRRYVVVEVHKW